MAAQVNTEQLAQDEPNLPCEPDESADAAPADDDCTTAADDSLSMWAGNNQSPVSALSQFGLVVHVFAPTVGLDRVEASDHLYQLWAAYRDRLGLNAALTSGRVPADPAANTTIEGPPAALAARRSTSGPRREAMWLQDNEVACISLLLAPAQNLGNERDESLAQATGWAPLYDEWRAATSGIDMDSALGTAFVFTALTPCPPTIHDNILADCVLANLPAQVEPYGLWAVSAVSLRHQVVLWEIGPAPDPSPERWIVALADAAHDPHLGAIVWTRTGPVAAPLTRYLLHAAKLRYHVRVRAQTTDIHILRQSAEATVDRLAQLLTEPPKPTEAELYEAWQELAALQTPQAGLINITARLQAMRRTTAIAAANMRVWRYSLTDGLPRSLEGVDHSSAADGPAAALPSGSDLFANDVSLAAWFDQRLDDDYAYLQTTRERATQISAMTERALSRLATDVERQAHRRQERIAQRQEQLTVISAAVITALLTCLTAIQALGYRLPLADELAPPIISTATAAALLLALLALHPRSPATRALRHTAAALVAATATWTAFTATWHTLYHQPAPTGATICASLISAAVVRTISAFIQTRPSNDES